MFTKFGALFSFTSVAFAAVLTAPAHAAPVADIVAPVSGDLSLGDHWNPLENQNGTGFRWVDSGAQVVIRHPAKHFAVLNVTVEAGPGLGNTQFPLVIKDSRGDQIGGIFVTGHESVHFVLPVDPNADNRFSFETIGGGHRVPPDKRILNFRVFAIDDGRTAGAGSSGGVDVTGNGVKVGSKGWYPIETFAGQTFRWISNDSDFSVDWPHDQNTQIRVVAEPGPGLNASSFLLKLQDPSGHDIGSSRVNHRGVATFNVSLHGGRNAFRFHVDGGGHKAPGDARTLNFRVFALSALQ